MTMRQDILTIEDVKLLVDRFYEKIRVDVGLIENMLMLKMVTQKSKSRR